MEGTEMNKDSRIVNLITNCRAKAMWQVTAEQYGVTKADKHVAEQFNETVDIVKSARKYW